MPNFRRYIRNIFPIGGLRIFSRDRGDFLQQDEYLVVSRYGNSSAAQRQIINDEQFLITFNDFLQEVADNTAQLDGVVTGASLSGGTTLVLTRSQSLPNITVNLSDLDNLDGVVTGATLEPGNILTLTRSQGLGNVTVDLSDLIQTASEVSTTSIPEVTGTNVQAMLASLKGLIDNILFTSINTEGGAVSLNTVNGTPLDSLFIEITVNSDITSMSFTDTSRMRLFIITFISTGATRSIEFGAGFVFDDTNNGSTNFTLGASPERRTVIGWFDGTDWQCSLLGGIQTASQVSANAISGLTGDNVQVLLESLKTLADNIITTSSSLAAGGNISISTTVSGDPVDSIFREITPTSDITSVSFTNTSRLRLFILRFSAAGVQRAIEFGAGFIFDESNNNTTSFTIDGTQRVTVLGWFDNTNWQCTILSDRQTASEVVANPISGLAGSEVQSLLNSLKILDDGQIQVNSAVAFAGGALSVTTTSFTELIVQETTLTGDITALSFTNSSRLLMFRLKFTADASVRNINFGAGFVFDESNASLVPFNVAANSSVTVTGFLIGGIWHCTIMSKPEGAGGGGAFWPLTGTGSITGPTIIEATGTDSIEIRNQDAANDRGGFSVIEFGGSKLAQLFAQSPTSNASVRVDHDAIQVTVGNGSPDTGGQINIAASTDTFEIFDYATTKLGVRYDTVYPYSNLVDRSLIQKQHLDDQIQSVSRTLTSAEILALNTTPITLVPAPGVGNMLVMLGPVTWLYDHNTTAYSTNTDVRVGYTTSIILAQALTILAATENAITQVSSGSLSTPNRPIADAENRPLLAYSQSGDPTLGDGECTVAFSYRIVSIPF